MLNVYLTYTRLDKFYFSCMLLCVFEIGIQLGRFWSLCFLALVGQPDCHSLPSQKDMPSRKPVKSKLRVSKYS